MIRINVNLAIIVGLIMTLFGFVIGLFIYIKRSRKNDPLYDTSSIQINRVGNDVQRSCSDTKTYCDPNDPHSCDICNDAVEMTCIDLSSISAPGSGKLNGEQAMCLPANIQTPCDVTKGGIYLWTGFGMTDNADWDCFCSAPQIFNGSGCMVQNPDFCSGGEIDTSQLSKSKTPDNSLCKCPPFTVLMYRAENNVPYCASTDPAKGGGMFGMAGNLSQTPSWRNVCFRATQGNTVVSLDAWAQQIAREMTLNDSDKITKVKPLLEEVLTKYSSSGSLFVLNKTIADELCGSATNVSPCRSMCNISANPSSVDFPDLSQIKDTYTYYQGDYRPLGNCDATQP